MRRRADSWQRDGDFFFSSRSRHTISLRDWSADVCSSDLAHAASASLVWVISAQTKDADAAWAVFEQYMGGKPAQDRAKSGWGVPGLKSMYAQMPQETAFQKQVQKVLQGELSKSDFILQFNPYIGEETFSTSWKKNLEPALKGSISFDKFVQNIEAEVNTAIADGKRIIGA